MLWLWLILGILGGLSLIFLFIRCNNNWLQVTRHTFHAGVDRGVKIVHLSDLHGKEFGRRNARLIAKIVKERPDDKNRSQLVDHK